MKETCAKSKEQQSKYRENKLTRNVADGVHGGNVGHGVAHCCRLEHVGELKNGEDNQHKPQLAKTNSESRQDLHNLQREKTKDRGTNTDATKSILSITCPMRCPARKPP